MAPNFRHRTDLADPALQVAARSAVPKGWHHFNLRKDLADPALQVAARSAVLEGWHQFLARLTGGWHQICQILSFY
ncbi:MAG: hypothetical protein ACOX2O_09810 [Bdellovibrionota bacterium]